MTKRYHKHIAISCKLLEHMHDSFTQEIQESSVLSLNLEYLQPGDKKILQHGDEVAVIPPISGG